jgi:dihydropteroate synthase
VKHPDDRLLPDFHLPQVMAIVNVTPDSFYTASRLADEEQVIHCVEQAVREGASIIDIGGYSSRPGATDVPLEEEWRRIELGMRSVRMVSGGVAVSIDTFRSEIAERALALDDSVIINDITAGDADPRIVDVVADAGAAFVAMHMRGTPATMQSLTDYKDVVAEVVEALRKKTDTLVERGISPERLILDPGFGFAKTAEQNFRLLAHLDKVCALGFPVLAGVSRKSMIYRTLGITPEESLAGTTALNWEALRQGATILRVHDVREAVQTVRLYNTFEQNR